MKTLLGTYGRKIEAQMIEAIFNGKEWEKDNTRVHPVVGGMEVQLHGNIIGLFPNYGFKFEPNLDTLRRWPTNTTKSRLRALGVDIFQRKGKIYISDKLICEV